MSISVKHRKILIMKPIPVNQTTKLEQYFQEYRNHVIGHNTLVKSPYGVNEIKYADWTASGRLYEPIEKHLIKQVAPYVGNTHTETNITGTSMTLAYHRAKEIIKSHVNADPKDVLIMAGSGMTGVVNKFQRILGLKNAQTKDANDRPVIFVSYLEHHSNDISWRETQADVEIINLSAEGNIDLNHLSQLLKKYASRRFKAAAITACSNVTGIQTPYYDVAKLMHLNNGWCFVDFACSAPYVTINMHPNDQLCQLDAVFFSMHKFLGGPGTPVVLIFNQDLYQNSVPDNPGGGTVEWVNPWLEQQYITPTTTLGIEAREDGGTPPFYQTIKSALCIKLKEQMGVEQILAREKEIVQTIFERLSLIPNLTILAHKNMNRLGIISFLIDDLHYNLGVKLLNDKYGIQVRGGCACAGPYGHALLNISKQKSKRITDDIDAGLATAKPGWIRLSIHPIMSNCEIDYILEAITEVASQFTKWANEYTYLPAKNEFFHITKTFDQDHQKQVNAWFEVKL